VIVARFVEDKSIREIALAMGRTEGAIKQLQFRAMQTLKTRSSNAPGEANE
jgi:RNA polymerase sigma-70 factor (ECF subfamily)